jgi:DeoR/GlpR family transcriptional regulator of sugar metabolism
VRTVQGHFADRLFLSVKGVAANGMLTDADPLEAEVKRAMIDQAGEATLLIDRDKLSMRGLSVIAPIGSIATTLAHGLTDSEADGLRLGGTTVLPVRT